jgi:ABC-type amino acid transport substrate-binding protein
MRRFFLLVFALICTSDAASAQSLEGRLKQIGETKVMKLAYRSDANPFSFVNAQGQPDGYTVDLCKFVVHSLELQLNAKLAIAWVPVLQRNIAFVIRTLGRRGQSLRQARLGRAPWLS